MTYTTEKAYLPALRGKIGQWVFYTTIMTFEEISRYIKLSTDIYKNKGLSDMMQRLVDSNRALAISDYLIEEKERFFPAMIVAVYGGSPTWMEIAVNEGRHKNIERDLALLSKSKQETPGFLVLSGKEKLFPLDGQHRLAGIKKVLDRPESEKLGLPLDEMTVTFVAHQRTAAGRVRSRRLFTTLNKKAVPVEKQDIILLDEDDIMAIATRHLAEKYDPLKGKDVIIFRNSANLFSTDLNSFTSAFTVYDNLCELFEALSGIPKSKLKHERIDKNLRKIYLRCAEAYYDSLIESFSEVKSCLLGKSLGKVIAKNRPEQGGHILFRTIGQKIMSKLVRAEIRRNFPKGRINRKTRLMDAPEHAISAVKSAVAKFSDLPIDLTEIPYEYIIYNPKTKRLRVTSMYESAQRDIILSHYGFGNSESDKKLNEKIRTITDEECDLGYYKW